MRNTSDGLSCWRTVFSWKPATISSPSAKSFLLTSTPGCAFETRSGRDARVAKERDGRIDLDDYWVDRRQNARVAISQIQYASGFPS
jgi:hypothetical protein